MSEREAIDIDRYAEVLAHIRHFPADKHAEVIARLGIRRRDWDAAATRWKGVRDAERMTGKLDVTVRFGHAMAAARAKLEARRPTLQSLGPFPGPDGAPAEAAPPVRATTAPAVDLATTGPLPPAVQVPSAFLNAGAGDGASRWGLGAPSYAAAPAIMESPVPPPAPHPVPMPAVRRAPSELTSTMPLSAGSPSAAATPFSAPAASPAETFRQAVAHADAAQGPAAPHRVSNELGTGTAALSGEVAAVAPPAGVPDLTLQQYASLRGDLDKSPAQAATILSRYGTSAQGYEALVAHWKPRFAKDPVLRMQYVSAFAQYIAWLKMQAGS